MTSTRLKVISLSESEKLKNLLKNPEDDLEEIVSLIEKKIEKTTNRLKEAEERYRSMITHTSDAVFCYEYNPPIPVNLPIEEQVKLLYSSVLAECNIVYAQSYGYERVEDVIGRKLTELFGTTSDSLDKLFMKLIEGGYHVVDGVGIEKLPNGEERYFLNNGHGVIENGKLLRVWGTFRDITERRKAEQKLEESEEKFRTITEQSLMGICIAQENKIKYINKAYSDIFGYTVDEMMNWEIKDAINAIHLDDRGFALDQLAKKQRGEKDAVVHYQYRGIKKSGEIVWIDQFSKSITYKGKPANLVALINITKKKEEEDAFLRERKFTDTALNAQRDTFFVFEPSTGKAIRWNNAFKEISGYSDEEIRKIKAPDSYYDDHDLKLAASAIEKMIKEGEALLGIDLITKDGRKIPFEYIGSSINDNVGNSIFIVTIGRDISERKEVEKTLRLSEKNLKKAQELAQIGHWELNTLTLEVSGSEELFKIFGLTKEEATLDAFAGVVHPDDKEYDLYHIRKGMETGESWDIEYRLICKDGTEKWVHSIGEATRDEGGKILRLIGTTQDITERKKVEQKLRESEEKYRTLVEISLQGIIIIQDLKIIFANSAMAEILGYSVEELLSISAEETMKLIHPEDRTFVLNRHKDRMEGKPVPNRYVYRVVRKDKKVRTIELYSTVIEYKGRIASQQVYMDITERKDAEQKLKESEEKFRTIAEQSLIGIGIVQDDIIKYVNKGLADMFGYSVEEMTKWPSLKFQKTIHPDDRDFVLEQVRKKQLGLEDYLREYQFRGVKKTGEIIWIDNFTQSITYEGKPADLVTLVDITKTKKAEQELIKLDNMKTDLIRRTSHELKTPLVSIKGFADLLFELHSDKLEDFVVDTILEIKQGCSRLETLISDILKTAELEFGSVQLHKTEENLSFLIKLCITELRGFSELRKHVINLKLLDNWVGFFEKEQIHQVISNILSNAIKYTPPYGTIEIESKFTGDFVIVSIKDNGIGLTQDEQSSIFTQFGKIERFGLGYDIISEGSGLGLYISKKIVELHGGEIWVESKGRNRGSKFFFSLPIIKR